MKVVLDPVMTNDPGHCASTVKMLKLVKHVLATRQDVFFYWLVPEEGSVHHKGMDWYPQHPNIKYVPYPYHRDRMREYQRLDRQYEHLMSFYGELWDAEVIVTNRTSLIPFIKLMALKAGRTNLMWTKRVFLIEDMPIMGFKSKLAISAFEGVQNRATIEGYLAADYVAVSAFWEKALILKEAKKYFMPAMLRQLEKVLVESSAVKVESTGLKTKASIQRMLDRGRQFTAAYIGRMVASSRANEIFELMQKNWIVRPNDKVRFLASTQSQSTGRVYVPDFVDVKSLPREGFWELCRNEIDVFIFMSKEEDYSMSLIEPLTLGCPAILIRAEWSIPTVGAEYPFFANNFTEAYALLREFYEDYPRMYKKFAEWSKTHFQPLMQERNKVYIGDLFEGFMDQQFALEADAVKAGSYANNEVVKLLVEYAKGSDELDIFPAIEILQKEGKLKFLAEKLDPEFKDKVVNAWQTDWYCLKMGLMCHGFRDASTKAGHFRRAS